MKRTLTVLAMAIALVLSTMAMAMADSHDGYGQRGDYECLTIGLDNPGETFQYVRFLFDENPAERVQRDEDYDNVADYIGTNCRYEAS